MLREECRLEMKRRSEFADIAVDGWDDGGVERAGVSVGQAAGVNARGTKMQERAEFSS